MPLLDVAKGIACALIVGHHLARYGPLPASASTLAPALFEWLADNGRLAVQVFLVLAGFLAAGSLAPDGVLRIDRPLLRVFQRYGRLAMPYLAALIASVLAAALVRPWLVDEAVPAAPGLAQLVAHGLLLQDLLGYEALSTGVWYVAIDFQLFVLALMAIGLSELLQRRWALGPERSRWLAVALVLVLAAASLAVFNRNEALDDTALYFFGAYGLGMLVFWIGRATRRSTWRFAVALLVLVGAAALALDWRSRIATALVTALLLVVAQRRGGLALGAWPPLLRLGRISYSLFLIHFPVLLLVSAVVSRLAPVGPWIGLLGLIAAFGLSIAAAALLYRWVESRAVTWPRVLALFAGLLACGRITAG
ncbi:acyltransferase family protein [Variovorax sp. RA8]|uniref:acyltransferase family protein n=1 Tax=Variovorax sp. (strain JCM 16519 / RA8) TaxID=662548 RepID=UPI001315F503|nr:Acyltransferase family protein [Variovorax sp. RA8]